MNQVAWLQGGTVTHRIGQISTRSWIMAVVTVVVLVAAGLVALRLSSSATSATSSPGVSSNEIVLGSHQPLTGPAAPGYSEVAAGAAAFFKYVNAHGGVYGRSIKFDYEDDQYNPVKSLTVTQKLVQQDKIFAMVGGLGTAPHEGVVNYLTDNKVPDLFVESGCTCFNEPNNFPYTFGYFPDYKIEGKILGAYVHTNYPDDKVAYVLQDDDIGQNSQEGLNQLISAGQVVTAQSFDPNYLANGLGNQIGAAKAAGARVVVLFGIPAAVAIAMLTAAQLDYHPTWVVSNVGTDPTSLGGLIKQYSKGAADISIANGTISDSYIPAPTDTKNPWVQLFRTVHDTYDSGQPFDFYAINGMTMAYGTYQALHAAGPKLTRESLLNAVAEKGSTFQGPNLAPYRFSTTDHDGMGGAQISTLVNGQSQLSGPVLVTDDHDAPVTTYSEPRPLPPTTF
ncbi:MAG TPA: ABC transporter substrate-binding protein [Pseudonocardiaceae bacterium]|jgi:ABC-type branched-subunit amino acid transport system substrate-binding protein|nr:ABC transporter substrate-binding protein [Pseudonocardiaceae bacterium]